MKSLFIILLCLTIVSCSLEKTVENKAKIIEDELELSITQYDNIDSLYKYRIDLLKNYDEVSFIESLKETSDSIEMDISKEFIHYASKRDSLVSSIEELHKYMYSNIDSLTGGGVGENN